MSDKIPARAGDRRAALLFAVLLVPATFAPATHAAPGDVIRELPSPTKYPAGLAIDGQSLYVLGWRDGKIHQIALTDGSVRQTFDAPTLLPHGLTLAGDRLIVSDDHTGGVFVLNPATGIIENTFDAPGSQPTGLAAAGDVLYLLERSDGRIYRVDPADGTILKYFAAPTPRCTTLAFDGTYLWSADRFRDELYRIDPETGMVIGILAAPGKHPAGLAWHDDRLWNVDFQSRTIYELVVDDAKQPYRLSDTRRARIEFHWGLYNYGPGGVTGVRLGVAIPPELPSQKLLGDLTWSTPPARSAEDQWGQRCAVLELGEIPAGQRHIVTYHVPAEVHAIRWLIDPRRAGTLDDIPDDIRRVYTADGARYRIQSPYIQKCVQEIVGDETNCYWIARRIFNHVIAKLEYQMVGGWDVPEVVLERGTGSCSEYTFAFIALCRAAGLPARYQGSLVVRGDDASVDEAYHRWAQVYLPNYGWIPIDANAGDKPEPADQAHGFGELSNRFLITTQGGGDSEFLGWSYNAEADYQLTGRAKVELEGFGFWEPLENESAEDEPAAPGPRGAAASKRPGQCLP